MRSVLTVTGVILSIVGFIAGIVLGSTVHNFLFCLIEWIGVFLFVVIYFGMAEILLNQETIMHNIQEMHNKQYETVKKESEYIPDNTAYTQPKSYPKKNEWKCPKCGKINQNYVGTCGCGVIKPVK